MPTSLNALATMPMRIDLSKKPATERKVNTPSRKKKSPTEREYTVVSASGRKFRISTIEEDDADHISGGANKVHTGPRGGKYVVVSGKKKYIK